MNYFTLLCFTMLIAASISGQERLTEFTSSGTNKHHFIQNYQGIPYLLSVDQDNILEVSRLVSKDEKETLHFTKFGSLFDNKKNIVLKDNNIIFPNDGKLLEYDFINDTIITTEFPEGYSFSKITYPVDDSKDIILVRLMNNSLPDVYTTMMYKIGGETKVFDDSPLQVFGDDIFCLDNTSNQNPYLKNLDIGSTDTLSRNLTFSQFPGQTGDSIFYFKSQNQIGVFNQRTRTKTKLVDLEVDPATTQTRFVTYKNELILLSTTPTNSELQFINLETKEVLESRKITHNDYLHLDKARIVDDAIVLISRTEGDGLLLFNLNSRDRVYKSTYFSQLVTLPVVNGTYLLNAGSFNGAGKFQLIEISSFSTRTLNGEFNLDEVLHAGVANFGNNFVAALTFEENHHDNLVNFDVTAALKAELNKSIDPSGSGLKSSAKLYKHKNRIYVSEDSLYKIENDNPVAIIPSRRIQEIRGEQIGIQNDRITFVQDNPKNLLSYNGAFITEETDFSSIGNNFIPSVTSYILTDNFVMMSTPPGIYTYDKNNKVAVKMEDVSAWNSIVIRNEDLFYVLSGNNLYSTDGYETTLILTINFNPFSNLNEVHLIFKDHLMIMSDLGLAKIHADNSYTLLPSPEDSIQVRELSVDKSGNNLIFGTGNKSCIKWHYDGTDIHEIELQYGKSSTITPSYDKIFFFSEIDSTDNSTLTFFNSETKAYGKLPEETQNKEVVTYYEWAGNGYLIMQLKDNPFGKLFIYKTDETFDEVKLLAEHLDGGLIGSTAVHKYGENGFLYAGHHLFTFDEYDNFQLLDNLKGHHSTQTVVLNDELYFLASDPTYGRQLFKMSNEPSTTEDAEIDEGKRTTLFPNPASSHINVSSSLQDSNPTFRYVIYNVDGSKKSSGTTTGLIEITNLTPGSYILEMISGDKVESTIFIKE